MGAGLAVIAIVGAILSYMVIQPTTWLGALTSVSLCGSAITVLVALLATARDQGADRMHDRSPSPAGLDKAGAPLAAPAAAGEQVLPV
ncbi:MAG: hypothetical protein U1E62_19105 [Alsobacter sp.]